MAYTIPTVSIPVGNHTKKTIDPASISAQTSATTNVSWLGAKESDWILVRMPSLESGLVVDSIVNITTGGTVPVRITNVTGGSINPASQSVYFIKL